ncbi:MAG: endonuclease III [Chloroflexi bacterium]|nr:endonuclease III [Chloroflexota bacterium]
MPSGLVIQKVRAIVRSDELLRRKYGEPVRSTRNAISQLVATMLSQATTDVQTDRSFTELRRRFPKWEQVRDAPASAIARAIRSSGLSKQKAPRIKSALRFITRERGKISLDFLRRLTPEDGKRWLEQIPGVGPKTASIVLLFSFDKPLFPVDTHVYRVTRRLGWLPDKASAAKAHDLLAAVVPPELHYRLHLNLIRLGREICHPRRPQCGMCPLARLCAYNRNTQKG